MQPIQIINLGDLTLRRESAQTITRQSIDRKEGQARARMYLSSSRDGLRLTIRDAFWENGERDVAVWDRHDAAQRFDRLRSGLRVTPHAGQLYVELRQARLKNTETSGPTSFPPIAKSSTFGAGVDVVEALLTPGATAVDTREVLLGDRGPDRQRMGALFPLDAEDVPAAAYALTRIAPLQRGVRA